MLHRSSSPSLKVRRRARFCALVGASLLPGSVLADTVHLKNGNVFEEVVAIDQGDTVVVQFGGGEMRLPKSRILRIDEALTPSQELAERKRALAGTATAREWLDFAVWAASHDLVAESKAATLRAAELDPMAPGLAPRMKELDHVLVDGEGWLSEATVMRRRGLVSYRGDWVTPEEKVRGLELERLEAETRRAAHEERERQLEVERKLARLEELEAADEERSTPADEAGPTDNDVALAQIDLMREVLRTAERPRSDSVPQVGVLVPAFAGAGAVFRTRASGPRDDTWRAMSVRQPGSLIPISDFRQTPPKR
ncbi:MAG: hypothetical protein AAF690_13565 [Acidobacteriota bacterium]